MFKSCLEVNRYLLTCNQFYEPFGGMNAENTKLVAVDRNASKVYGSLVNISRN